ncbi:MAG: DUF134 domain-containing protein [Candidatus Shapirobacteria bacterium]
MPRRKKTRKMCFCPEITYFKPRGMPLSALQVTKLENDELEALYLADFEGQDQIESAKKMEVSQSTFQRILKSARKKTALALILGQAISLKGGEEKMVRPRKGMGLGRSAPVSGGRGRMGGPLAAGPGGICACVDCKCEAPHKTGVACYQTKCPKCGGKMVRKRE